MIKLYTYHYWNPNYRQYIALDCGAFSPEQALVSARRFIRTLNGRYARCGLPRSRQVRMPSKVRQMRLEEPRAAAA